MSQEENHRDLAIDSLEGAREGLGETGNNLENAKLYAMIGIGEAVMCVYHVLIDVRNQFERK
jgi:hypothetical protein